LESNYDIRFASTSDTLLLEFKTWNIEFKSNKQTNKLFETDKGRRNTKILAN